MVNLTMPDHTIYNDDTLAGCALGQMVEGQREEVDMNETVGGQSAIKRPSRSLSC